MYAPSRIFLFTVQFLLNGIFRYAITTHSARKIHQRIIGFNTLIIGDNEKAKKLYLEFITIILEETLSSRQCYIQNF